MKRFVFDVSRQVKQTARVMVDGDNKADAIKKLDDMKDGLSWNDTGENSGLIVEGIQELKGSNFLAPNMIIEKKQKNGVKK